jgi:hypothetical protein
MLNILAVFVAVPLVLALTGCFLISGPVQSTDNTPDGGNVYVGFVSAEGNDTRTVTTNFPNQTLEVTVFAQNQRGQMRVEILDAQNSVSVVVDGQAEEQARVGTVQTNEAGEFRYRVRATGAQRGAFQILYQPTNG